MKKAEVKSDEVKPDEELTHAVETLEQITDEWLEQQRFRFKNTNQTSHIKWIPDCYVLKLFKNTMCKKRRFGDILDMFRLYIPKIIGSFKEIGKNIIVRSMEFMLKVERYEDKAEKKS